MHSSGRLKSPPQPESLKTSLRRRLAGWAGVEDRPPVAQESWWWPDERSTRHHHHHSSSSSGRADSSDTASISSLGRCDSESTQGDSSDHPHAQSGKRRSRKRDWFKVLLAARNLATCVYAVSFTTSLPILPFATNRLIFPREPDGLDDPGSEGVREAWRGMAYGLVMSGYHFTKMISAPWIGFLSDRIGRRQALVVTLLGGAFSFYVTKVWGQHTIHGMIVCRMLMGCFAANGALMHAYIRDTVSLGGTAVCGVSMLRAIHVACLLAFFYLELHFTPSTCYSPRPIVEGERWQMTAPVSARFVRIICCNCPLQFLVLE